jgi:hypothetical protein
MESVVIASKAPVQICVPNQDGATSHHYTMDLSLDKDTFHCKFRTHARSIDTANKVKKAFVYLFLDASHLQSLKVCDNDEEAVPYSIKNALVNRALCTSSDSISRIRFVLKGHAPLIAPESLLKRNSSRVGIETLLQVGQCKTFTVYVPSGFISGKRLLALCNALAQGALRPAPEGVITSLYTTVKSRIITHLDELWPPSESGVPPAYDSLTAPGNSDDESTGQSDFRPRGSLSASRKRQISSPASRRTPSKRRVLTEKVDTKPWELAIAAQGAQIAALCAQVSTLCEEVQRLRCAKVVDAGPNPVPYYVSPSHASTVVNTNEESFMIARDNVIGQQEQRALSDTDLDHNNEQVCTQGLLENDDGQTTSTLSDRTLATASSGAIWRARGGCREPKKGADCTKVWTSPYMHSTAMVPYRS